MKEITSFGYELLLLTYFKVLFYRLLYKKNQKNYINHSFMFFLFSY